MNLTIVALVAALLGPIITLILGYRRFSGSISTSAASDLWDESKAIRDFMQERNEFLTSKIEKLEARIRELENKNAELYLQNGRMGRMLEEQQETISSLRTELTHVHKENDTLKSENRKLKKRVSELEALNGAA